MMDPTKTSLAAGQIGFIKFLCLGLFEQMARVFPAMQVCVDQMKTNLEAYQKSLDSTKKE
jgi:hypothetical protein